jgi:hypothetical protein
MTVEKSATKSEINIAVREQQRLWLEDARSRTGLLVAAC